MRSDKWKIAAWISTAIVVIAGLYITKSANCIWAMMIPALFTI